MSTRKQVSISAYLLFSSSYSLTVIMLEEGKKKKKPKACFPFYGKMQPSTQNTVS